MFRRHGKRKDLLVLLLAMMSLVQIAFYAVSALAVDVKAYAFICGFNEARTELMLKDTRVGTTVVAPVTFFVIKHGQEWVAFDTGNNAMAAKDFVGYWGQDLAKIFTLTMKDDEEFQVQIKKLGISPKNMSAVILSHGHPDHAGAIEDFKGTNVPIYLQKKELDEINREINKAIASGKKRGYLPDDFKFMNELNIKTIEGVFDVFGDQTVVAFPTPGHTPGHQSLLVKPTEGKILVLTGDAMYSLENMEKAILPGTVWDIPQSLQSLYVFKVMKYIGAEVVPPHDPDFWKNKPLAPKPFIINGVSGE